MAKQIKYAHYRPHARVQEKGELVNHVTGEVTRPPSMTKQEFKRECDINNILKQYSTTGMLQHVSARASTGAYLDLPDSVEFQDSLNLVRQAEATFMGLPAKLRDRFGNDPAEFLAFCADPANLEEMRELGLANPKPNLEPPPKAPEKTPDNEGKAPASTA